MKLKFTLNIVVLFLYHLGIAQLHIAKDNINCLYGLKNENNKWVLKPTYAYIEEAYHNSSVFQVFDGQNRGIISAEDGKVIIPCCQDRFDISSHYFIGYKNEKTMVYNRNGKPLSAQVYDEVRPYEFSNDYLWCYKNYPDSVLTSLMQVDVGFLFHGVNGFVHEWQDSTYTIVQQNMEWRNHLLGIIDSTGKIIIPKLYDDISIWKNYFVAYKRDTVLFLNNKNEIVNGPFIRITNLDYTILVTKHDSSCSLINYDLEEIIPFGKYDKMEYLGYKKWLKASQNKKYGVVDSIGNIIIPFIYDDLISVGYIGNYYSDSILKFIYKINNKYGVLNKNGGVEINAEYDFYELKTDNRYSLYFLINNNEIFYIDLSGKPKKLQYLFENEKGSFYKDDVATIFMKLHSSTGNNIIEAGQISPNYGMIYLGNLFSLYPKNNPQNTFEVFNFKGEKLFTNQLKTFYRTEFYLPNTNTNDYSLSKYYSGILAITKNNMVGLFSYKTGKLLIDTLYSSIISSSHFFYNSENFNLICKQKLSQRYDIYDTLGTKIKTIECDTFYQQQQFNYKRAGLKGKMGIVDNNYDWYIKPQYRYIEPLTENLFLIVNQNKKVGIIDSNNKLLVDTAYTDFIPVFNNFQKSFFTTNDTINGFTSDKKELWWLLKNSNERVLVNNNGKSIKSYSSRDSCSKIINNLLLKFAFNGASIHCGDGFCDYSFIKPDGSHNIADGALKITMVKEDKDFLLKQLYVNQLFDILEKTHLDEIKILKNYNNSALGFTTNNSKILKNVLHKEIYAFGKSHVSLYINYFTLTPDSSIYSNDYNNNYSYENYIVIDGKLNLVTLDSIFKNDVFFQTEILEAIKKEEDLKLDCTNINNLYQKISGKFSLSNDGIYLMIEDENYNQRGLLIPKKRLMANKYAQWIISYLN